MNDKGRKMSDAQALMQVTCLDEECNSDLLTAKIVETIHGYATLFFLCKV